MAEEDSMVRVGKVSAVDKNNYKARVWYPSMSNMVSDWLPILQHPNGKTNTTGYHKHGSPVGDTDSAGGHSHNEWKWLPNVNDKVLVIMEYGFNSQGYIVGVIP